MNYQKKNMSCNILREHMVQIFSFNPLSFCCLYLSFFCIEIYNTETTWHIEYLKKTTVLKKHKYFLKNVKSVILTTEKNGQ